MILFIIDYITYILIVSVYILLLELYELFGNYEIIPAAGTMNYF